MKCLFAGQVLLVGEDVVPRELLVETEKRHRLVRDADENVERLSRIEHHRLFFATVVAADLVLGLVHIEPRQWLSAVGPGALDDLLALVREGPQALVAFDPEKILHLRVIRKKSRTGAARADTLKNLQSESRLQGEEHGVVDRDRKDDVTKVTRAILVLSFAGTAGHTVLQDSHSRVVGCSFAVLVAPTLGRRFVDLTNRETKPFLSREGTKLGKLDLFDTCRHCKLDWCCKKSGTYL